MAMSRGLVPGRARGEALVLVEPLSLWGGADASTGRIVEPAHEQFGSVMTGRILVMSHGRGSSSSSSVLAEMLRLGVGPAGIVLREMDSILVVGSLVAGKLYGSACPIVLSQASIGEGTVEIDGELGTVESGLENEGGIADNN